MKLISNKARRDQIAQKNISALNKMILNDLYSEFMIKKPKKQFFIPCDAQGNIIEEPSYQEALDGDGIGTVALNEVYKANVRQYQAAKSKVLLTGFDVDKIQFYCNHTEISALVGLDTFILTDVALEMIGEK